MREKILALLESYNLEDGDNLVSRDLVRALNVDGRKVSFVLEAPSSDIAQNLEARRADIQNKLLQLLSLRLRLALLLQQQQLAVFFELPAQLPQ